MVSVDELLRFGYSLGLNEDSRVLDLCCGYGTVLKIWHEAFGISGTGVDRWREVIVKGQERLDEAGISRIALLEGDVLKYEDDRKYDVVICSETFNSIADTILLGEKFLKPGGVLAYQKVYSNIPIPPRELTEFDGEVLPLGELNGIFNDLGYMVTHLATSSTADWERFITWNARRDISRLRRQPEDEGLRNWIDKWYRMYFDYRRPYEGQALFGLERL